MRFLILLLLASCATQLTDEQRYEREDALILAREGFERRKAVCQDAGGVMVMERNGVTSRRYTKWDYSRAYCVKGY